MSAFIPSFYFELMSCTAISFSQHFRQVLLSNLKFKQHTAYGKKWHILEILVP